MKEVEKKIRRDPFIKDAQLYSDLKGNLVVSAELRRPIARIVRNDGPDGYISEDGTDNASVGPVYFAGHSSQWSLCEADVEAKQYDRRKEVIQQIGADKHNQGR